jgi:heme A synthase
MSARGSSDGPGPVAAVHRILIVTALIATLFYAAWEARESMRTGETLGLVRAAIAFLVSIGIGVYLRTLRGLGAKLTPRD